MLFNQGSVNEHAVARHVGMAHRQRLLPSGSTLQPARGAQHRHTGQHFCRRQLVPRGWFLVADSAHIIGTGKG